MTRPDLDMCTFEHELISHRYKVQVWLSDATMFNTIAEIRFEYSEQKVIRAHLVKVTRCPASKPVTLPLPDLGDPQQGSNESQI